MSTAYTLNDGAVIFGALATLIFSTGIFIRVIRTVGRVFGLGI